MDATQTSAALLRVVSSLIAHVDPSSGGKASTLRRAVEELKEVQEDAAILWPPDIRTLLYNAVSSLAPSARASTSSSSSFAPYTTCLFAISSLTQAAHSLSLLASPPRPSPMSRLPPELLAHVVHFCQSDDLRLRQRTNVALAETSTAFYRAVRPILEREVHLFTAGQLDRLALSIHGGERDGASVRVFTADLAISEIEQQLDGSWPGWQLGHLLFVGAVRRLETLHLRFAPPSQRPPGRADPLLEALGVEPYDLLDFYSQGTLVDARIPTFTSEAPFPLDRLFQRVPHLKRLQIGELDWPVVLETSTFDNAPPASVLPAHLTALSIPWYRIKDVDLVSLVSGGEGGAPQLERLEVAVEPSQDIDTRAAAVQAFFRQIAPTIRHLSLRLVERPLGNNLGFPPPNIDPVYGESLCKGLSTCTSLQHLELGMTERVIDVEKYLPLLGESQPPSLRSLVFLSDEQPYNLAEYAETRPAAFKSVTTIRATSGELPFFETDSDGLRQCRDSGLEVKMESRAREEAWWKWQNVQW